MPEESEKEAQILADRFMELPEELQELMLDEEFLTKAEHLSEHYQFQPNQKDLLLEEISLVLMRITPLANFKERLIVKLQIPIPRATTLAADIDKEIFSPVHHLLLTTTSVNIPTSGVQSPQETAQVKPATSGGILVDQIAQFQARKKQREEEERQKLNTQPTPVAIAPVVPPNLPQ